MSALAIAGAPIDLDRSVARSRFADRYFCFARTGGAARWVFALSSDGTDGHAPIDGHVDRFGNLLRPRGLETAGCLDLATRRAVVSSDPFLRALDVLLRAAVQIDVAERGGLLVHASAVLAGGSAHLFVGPSGAGKSTAAALARQPFADEICAIVPSADGFLTYATPWWGGRPEPAPLAGVYSLARDAEAVIPLGSAAALRHLLGSVVLPLDGPAERAASFAAAGRVARVVVFARFAFRLDSDVDALLLSAGSRRAA